MSILIPAHGGYKNLKSFQTASIVYDLTVEFCERYVQQWRMKDQMIQAARSGRQNIAEGSQVSGTSKKTEIKLVNVARASLEELLLDYQDFLRQRQLPVWPKDSSQAREVRALAYRSHRSNVSYGIYMTNEWSAANALLCLVHQANYLLDRQLRALEQQFKQEGGFTERLYWARKMSR